MNDAKPEQPFFPYRWSAHLAQLMSQSAVEIGRMCEPKADATTYEARAKAALDNSALILGVACQVVHIAAQAMMHRGWGEEHVRRELRRHGVVLVDARSSGDGE